jgi:hypothetical protein
VTTLFSRFTESTLWKILKGRKGDLDKRIAAAVQPILEEAEMILLAGSSATKDFTLHDHAHAFRVAERMYEIVGDELVPKLSGYELALLLLSAYLHDIGMAPAENHVNRYRRHILYGDATAPDRLSEAESLDLRKFLDNSSWQITLPLGRDGKADAATHAQADEVLTDYCRHKHNDWSEAWVKANLEADNGLPHYTHWQSDLILICKSHHYGYEHLKKADFDPSLVWG